MADEEKDPTSEPEPSASVPGPEPEAASAPAESMAADALQAAMDAVQALEADAGSAASGASGVSAEAPSGVEPFVLPKLSDGPSERVPAGVSLLSDVNLHVKIELGRTVMLVEDVLKLSEGAVVELDKLAGDPVDVYVNEKHIARGEVLVLNDNFCVRISEILSPAGREGAASSAA